MSFAPSNSRSSYLPPEFSFPVGADQEKVRELISQRERITASILNIKTNGSFQKLELLSGEQWFTTATSGQPNVQRYGYRSTYDIVALFGASIPTGGTASVPHGLDVSKITAVTRLYGGAISNGPFLLPIPYASSTANLNIELYFDSTNINVINGSGQNKITQCYVVIEYLKQ